jgi:hypothetical protein
VPDLPRPRILTVDREELVLLGRIRRLSLAHRLACGGQDGERIGRELDDAHAEYHKRFQGQGLRRPA